MRKYLAWGLCVAMMLGVYSLTIPPEADGEVSSPSMYSVTNALQGDPQPFSIAGTATDLSNIVPIYAYEHFSYASKCVSVNGDGTADYKLELFLASENEAAQFKEIAAGDLISTDTTEDWITPTAIHPPVSGFAQFKFSGVNSNPTDTRCNLIFNRERSQ